MRYPGGESFTGVPFAEMVTMARGEQIYDLPHDGTFHAAIYGPLYYLLGARLVDPAHPAEFPLRIPSALAFAACLGMISFLAKRTTRSTLAAWFAPLLFLSYGLTTQLGSSARSDMVGLALAMAGFVVADLSYPGRRLFLAIPVLVIALFYKQQFFAAPMAIVLALALERSWRRAAAFLGGLAVCSGAVLGLFEFVIFRGQHFLLHFIRYNVTIFSLSRFGWGLLITGILFGVPCLLAGEYFRRHSILLLSCYAVCAILVAIVGLGKEGSGTSYYVETMAVLAIPIAGLVAEALRTGEDAMEIGLLMICVLLAGTRIWSHRIDAQDFAEASALTNYLQSNFPPDAKILTAHPGEVIRAGLQAPVTDLFQYHELRRKGVIADELCGQVRQQSYTALLLPDKESGQQAKLTGDFLDDCLRKEVAAHYIPVQVIAMPAMLKTDDNANFRVWVRRR
jgi:hypothetical protein